MDTKTKYKLLKRFGFKKRLQVVLKYVSKMWKRFRRYALFAALIIYIIFVVSIQKKFSKKANYEPDLKFLNLSDYLLPEKMTALALPKTPIICREGSVPIIYFIASAANNYENRQAIRNTWGQELSPRPIFFTGHTGNKNETNQLTQEAVQYQDMVVENFIDSYKNLTIKVGFMFKHFEELCPRAQYFMKTDDDYFINVPLVLEILRNVSNSDILVGHLLTHKKTSRDVDDKWFLNKKVVPDDELPNYLAGGSYIVPNIAVSKIYKAALSTPIITIEDIYYMGYIANKKLNMTFHHDDRFQFVKPSLPFYYFYKDIASAHGLSPLIQHLVWNSKSGIFNGLKRYLFGI